MSYHCIVKVSMNFQVCLPQYRMFLVFDVQNACGIWAGIIRNMFYVSVLLALFSKN